MPLSTLALVATPVLCRVSPVVVQRVICVKLAEPLLGRHMMAVAVVMAMVMAVVMTVSFARASALGTLPPPPLVAPPTLYPLLCVS